jgi:hypothetical protein
MPLRHVGRRQGHARAQRCAGRLTRHRINVDDIVIETLEQSDVIQWFVS